MDTGLEIELEQAIKEVARTWPKVKGPSDPNTIDLYWQAQKVQERFGLRLPQTLPSTESGVALVELVENHFVRPSQRVLIRNLSPDDVAERARELVSAIYNVSLQSSGPKESYVTALYTWHGCINMAKLLRFSYNVQGGQAAYSDEQRTQGYNWLQECWTQEAAKGNPWVRYGVTLARPLEMNRKKDKFGQKVIEDWVPRDSPYWEAK